jgi:hypothetical protein
MTPDSPYGGLWARLTPEQRATLLDHNGKPVRLLDMPAGTLELPPEWTPTALPMDHVPDGWA